MRFFATAIPGVGPILREELAEHAIEAAEPEFDGRNDIVAFAAPGSFEPSRLRTSEDVYAEVRSVRESGAVRVLVHRLWDDRAVERALSVYGARVRPLRGAMTFRVIARVLSERTFTRRMLRDTVTAHVQAQKPRWRQADVSVIEVWVLETMPGHFRLGLRLTGASMRHRDGRVAERSGALRPTVAAAMVRLARGGGPLVDVTCGSGTIVSESVATGRASLGCDIDENAIEIARDNVAGGRFFVADARTLPLPDARAGAVVSNLPFGETFSIEGDEREWFARVVGEAARIARAGGALVMLAPERRAFRDAISARPDLNLERTLEMSLLGMPTALWVLRRM